MFKLDNKTSIVTGASKGIGKSIAVNLAKNGSNLCLISRNKSDLNYVKEIITNETDSKVSCFSLDVSNFESVQDTFKKIISDYKSIDILVNNAGITKDNILLRMNKNEWDEVLNINLTGYFNTCKSAIKQMIRQKYGRIINISSIVGLKGNAGQVNYSASKAGIVGLSNSLSKEVGSRNITVNTVAPGFIETNMTKKLDEKTRNSFLAKLSINRFGNPQDISNLVCFLASDLSDYITGQTINIDGGMD